MVQVLLIAAFVVLFLRESLERPLLRGVGAGGVAGVYLGGLAAISVLMLAIVWVQGRRLDRTGAAWAVRRADSAVLGSRVAAVVVHAFAVLGLGWLDVVRGAIGDLLVTIGWASQDVARTQAGDLVLVDELLTVAPVLAVFVLGWWAMYPIDRRLREAVLLRELDEGRAVRPMPGRGAYVLNAGRHQAALVLVPIVFITGWVEGVGAGVAKLPRFGMPAWFAPLAAQLVGMALVLTMMPLVLRRVWSTVVLGPGPLRDRLTEMCSRQGVKVRELLVWGTHGTMINGAVMGFVGPVRYILLTDALLEALLAGLVVFGFVSRRFEWQADAFAVQHLSGGAHGEPLTEDAAVAMAGALEAVARLNRIPREKFTWRHGSIGSRQRRLVALAGQRADGLAVDRQVRRLKIAAAIAFVVAIGVIVLTSGPWLADWFGETRHALREDARDR